MSAKSVKWHRGMFQNMEHNTCCVCSNSYSLSKSLDVVGIHFEKIFLCGKLCEQALIQAVAFVQGFLLGKVVSSCVQDTHNETQLSGISDFNLFSPTALSTNESGGCSGNEWFKSEPAALFSPEGKCSVDVPSEYFGSAMEDSALVDTSNSPESAVPISPKRLRSRKYASSVKRPDKKKKIHSRVNRKTRQQTENHAKDQRSELKLPCLSSAKNKRNRIRSSRVVEENTLHENNESEEFQYDYEESGSLSFDELHTSETNDSMDRECEVSCPHCGKGFKNTKTMKAHVRVKHQNNVKICRICQQKCFGQIGLSLHMKSKHAGEKANECDICKERFPYSTDLERHVTLIHGKDRFICHICGKHFRYWHTLQSHVKAHSGVRAYVCEHCGKGFLRGNTLIDHKKSHFCRVCKKKLISGQCPDHPKPRYTHNYQSGLSLLQCKECTMTFESIDALDTHIKTHEMQRPFHCQVCGKGFHTSQHLYKHSKQHEEKQFQCGVCAKKFTYKCNMQKHQETHAEERPFSCEFCNRSFKNKRALETHLPRHIEERQFKCHICGKGLTRRAKLKEHLLKMHPVA